MQVWARDSREMVPALYGRETRFGTKRCREEVEAREGKSRYISACTNTLVCIAACLCAVCIIPTPPSTPQNKHVVRTSNTLDCNQVQGHHPTMTRQNTACPVTAPTFLGRRQHDSSWRMITHAATKSGWLILVTDLRRYLPHTRDSSRAGSHASQPHARAWIHVACLLGEPGMAAIASWRT